MLQCGTGSFLRKYFYTKNFPTKVLLHENFWIYGMLQYGTWSLRQLKFAVCLDQRKLQSLNHTFKTHPTIARLGYTGFIQVLGML